MKIAQAGALIMALLAASSAVAQTPQSQPQPLQTMPRTETPVVQGETLNVARPAALIRFDGVRGESQSKPGWIDAFSLTVTCGDAQTVQAGQEGRTGDAAAGTQSPRTLTFTHRMEGAAPALFDAATSGKRFRTAEVDQRGTKLRIEDVQITRVIEDARGTNRATQTVTLIFGKCSRQ
jgi:type VI protein secretion system component Hcp